MPRPKGTPTLCRHKASGLAYASFNRKRKYFGRWPEGLKEAPPEIREKFERYLAEWLVQARTSPERPCQLTIAQLIVGYWQQHVVTYYRHADGSPTGEVDGIRLSLRQLNQLYGSTLEIAFSPLALKTVREAMIRAGLRRKVINQRVRRIVRMFRWAVGNELLPVHVLQALQTVDGLRKGRCTAPESQPVTPVCDDIVWATLPYLAPQLQAMVQLQRYTGMRPGEVVLLRGIDVTITEEGWIYQPAKHKTARLGKKRVIPLGPKARALLKPWLRPNLEEYLFQPVEVIGKATLCGKKLGSRYTTNSYDHAILNACYRAFPPPAHLARQRVPARGRKHRYTRWETVKEWRNRLGPEGWKELQTWRQQHRWHPHQLRHTFNTEASAHFGPDHAQAALGHSSLKANEVYDHAQLEKAKRVMEQLG
jgi:integrase